MDLHKQDEDKLKLTLIEPEFIEEFTKVLMFGAAKYSENSWKYIFDAKERTLNSILRHLLEIRKGNEIDKESGHLHIVHAATQAMVYYYHLKRETENELRS